MTVIAKLGCLREKALVIALSSSNIHTDGRHGYSVYDFQ